MEYVLKRWLKWCVYGLTAAIGTTLFTTGFHNRNIVSGETTPSGGLSAGVAFADVPPVTYSQASYDGGDDGADGDAGGDGDSGDGCP